MIIVSASVLTPSNMVGFKVLAIAMNGMAAIMNADSSKPNLTNDCPPDKNDPIASMILAAVKASTEAVRIPTPARTC